MICLNKGATFNRRERQALRLRLFHDLMETHESYSERQEEHELLSLKPTEALGVLWAAGTIHPHQLCVPLPRRDWVLSDR